MAPDGSDQAVRSLPFPHDIRSISTARRFKNPKHSPRVAAQPELIVPILVKTAWSERPPRSWAAVLSLFRQNGSRVGSTTASERSTDRIATFRCPAVWAVEPFAAAARPRCTGNFRAQSPGQRHAANILRRRGAAAMSTSIHLARCMMPRSVIANRQPSVAPLRSPKLNSSRRPQKAKAPFSGGLRISSQASAA
jgi:hypothetical protein